MLEERSPQSSLLISKQKRASLNYIPDMTEQKNISKRRQLISPVSLLNDRVVVKKERNMFTGLKGDKQILRHYPPIAYNLEKFLNTSIIEKDVEQTINKGTSDVLDY